MYKNIIKEVGINFVITFGLGILSFYLNKVFSDSLGSENLGLMRLFTQLIAYLNLAEMGVGTATAYSLYKPFAEKNYFKVSIVVNTIENLYNKVFYGIVIGGIAVTFLLPFLSNSITIKSIVLVYWLIYVLNTALSYKFAKYSILFTANQEYKYVRLVQGLVKIIITLLQIISLIKIKSFLIFTLLISLENILQYIFYKKHYLKNYNYIKKTEEKDLSIRKNIFNLFWHKLGGVIIFNTDYIIISKFISLTAVGVYSSYMLIIGMLNTIVMTILNVINPKIGNFIAQKSKNEIFSLWKSLNIMLVFIGTILTVGTFINIDSFIFLWMGEDYIYDKKIIILLMINLFILLTRGITDIFKNNSGFYDDVYLPIIESLLNLVVSIILVINMGIAGVIIGTIVSNILIIYLWSPILIFKRCFDKEGIDYLKKLLQNILSVYVSSFICVNFLKKLNLDISLNWKIFILNVIKSGLIISVISIVVFLFHKDFRENTKLLLNILKSKLKRS